MRVPARLASMMEPPPAAGASRPRPAAGILSALRASYEYVVFYGSLAAFGIISLLWSLPAAALYPLLPHRIGEPLGRFMIMAGFRCFVKVMKISGIIRCDLGALDALRVDKSLVIAPNHPSLLDAVLVLSRLPRVVCIMKPAILDNIFLGGGARLAGFIRNDASVSLIKQAAEQVSAGHHLLVFPEGTRTSGPPVNPFKGGFALIARKAGAPVQTVFIETNSTFLGKSWPFFKKPDFPLVYRIRLGRRFEVGDDVHLFTRELERYFSAEIAARGREPRSA
jgi:1-acyl-sn-glycerol-3-phosphate acyltransferase